MDCPYELTVWLACQYISDLHDRIIAQERPRILQLFNKYMLRKCVERCIRASKPWHLGTAEMVQYKEARARYEDSRAEYKEALHPYKFMREYQNVRHGLSRRALYHALPSSARRRQ